MAATTQRVAFVSNEFRDITETNTSNKTLYGDLARDGGRDESDYVETAWDDASSAQALADDRTAYSFVPTALFRLVFMGFMDIDFKSGTPSYDIIGKALGLTQSAQKITIMSVAHKGAKQETEVIGFVKL